MNTSSDRRLRARGPLLFAGLVLGAVALGAVACSPPRDAERISDSANAIPDVDSLKPVAPPAPDTADLRVEIDITQRCLRVFGDAGDTIAVHPVAVGSPEWPTRPGSWAISQVVLNPEWIPPAESWADTAQGKAPGAPDNPLGAAQLVYDLPRTIHGTNTPGSVGKAVSHGSLRVTNTVALALSRLVLERTGVSGADSLIAQGTADTETKRVIDLPKVVPIRVF